MILPTIVFVTFSTFIILMMIGTIKDMMPDKDEIEFQRKMLEYIKRNVK